MTAAGKFTGSLMVLSCPLRSRFIRWRLARRLFSVRLDDERPGEAASGNALDGARRGKCHGYFFTFSRSLPVVLAVTWPDDFGCMDG